MAKLDETKAKLDEFKTYRNIVLGTIITILGWIATSYKTTDNVLIICGLGVALVLVAILVALIFAINDKIKELGKL